MTTKDKEIMLAPFSETEAPHDVSINRCGPLVFFFFHDEVLNYSELES